MRTTVTLEHDVHRALRDEARQTGRSFKSVLNDFVRRGLAADARPAPRARFRVEAERGGLLPGIDPLKLNQLGDELQDEERIAQMRRDGMGE